MKRLEVKHDVEMPEVRTYFQKAYSLGVVFSMSRIFDAKDRQEVFDYILSGAKACSKIVSLVQVGSGAVGYHDERSDLDFVAALDTVDSMPEVMEYMHRLITAAYEISFFTQDENRHLQVFLLTNLLEIDIGYGGYEHAAASKPAFKVLYDRSGTVEDQMIRSRAWIDDKIYGEKQKKDLDIARRSYWIRMMHAATAINRGHFLRAIGELEQVRKFYVDLLGDRLKLESGMNREMDRLPENEKAVLMGTYVTGKNENELWESLIRLTDLLYGELEGEDLPVSREMMYEYYKNLR